MTNDQKIAACLKMLGLGVALDPNDRATFDDYVESMEKKPEKAKEEKAK